MLGIDRYSGKTIDGIPQLASRLRELFTTRTGSLPKRRNVGTLLLDSLGRDQSPVQIELLQHHLLEQLSLTDNGFQDIIVNQIQIQTGNPETTITIIGEQSGAPFSIELNM